MGAILKGIRILDLSIWMQGPSATAMLGDMGAEIIKVEPLSGEPSRGLIEIMRKTTDLNITWDFFFEYFNRNKKSLALNLKEPRGKDIIYRLAANCDVLVQNFRLGVIERLGLGYEELKKHNPKLIYASATGYGTKGPDSAEPSFDYMGQARSGLMSAISEAGVPPIRIGGGLADQMGAIMLAFGILAAIIDRDRHGIGQKVDISHLGSMMHLQGLNVQTALATGHSVPTTPRDRAGNVLWNHYRCGDGKWICLGMIESHRYWHDFCSALGIARLERDLRFRDTAFRSKNREELIAILDERFATRTRDEWMKILKEGGDFIYTALNDYADLENDPQAALNDYIVEQEHPVHGKVKVAGFPVQYSESPCKIQSHAPEVGEHSEEILSRLGGYGQAEIEELPRDNVVASSKSTAEVRATEHA